MLILYGTAGCRLCEQAEQLLRVALLENYQRWQSIDIAEDETLAQRYGVRIPVLKRTDSGAELGWPFNATELACFLT